jgi:serine protease Do
VRYAYGVAWPCSGGNRFLGRDRPGRRPGRAERAVRDGPRPARPMSFADLAARLQPAVVNISTKQRVPVRRRPTRSRNSSAASAARTPQGRGARASGPARQGGRGQGSRATREAGSLGSGFIISPDGYVVTNNHLIQGASGTGTVDSVTVTLTDRKEYPARIVGRDTASDLALLKIEGSQPAVRQLGRFTRARVGDWVLAIGNPYGLGGTVTAGIISALHRGITGRRRLRPLHPDRRQHQHGQ